MKSRIKNILMWSAIILMLLLSVANILITLHTTKEQDKSVNDRIQSIIQNMKEIPVPKNGIDGSNGNTPVKGVDYFDGINGKDGVNGSNGLNGVNGTDGKDGKDGVDGKNAYFDIRCNEDKNRWEVRVSADDTWQILNGTPVRCTL